MPQSYNFLVFTDYLNKRQTMPLTRSSILLFVLNIEDFDYALLAVDLINSKLIIYDCVEGRAKDTFLIEVKKVRTFVREWIDYMPIQ